MSFEYFIGARYLRAKQRQAFISLITMLSIAGVAVGVMALIVVIAVMSGFESDLKSRILAGQSHIVLMRHGGPFTAYRRVIEKLQEIEGVEATILRSFVELVGKIGPETARKWCEVLERVNSVL